MANPLPFAVRERAGFIATAAILAFLTVLTSITSPVDAAKSFVTVFADGEERTITTTVLTVGEALERAEINLGEHDLVEPSLDTFINESAFSINVYRAKPVTVVDGTKQMTVMTPYTSPRLIAESAGLDVHSADIFEFELIDDILAAGAIGQRLIIDRATPVNVSLYGDVIEHHTHATTVGEVLGEVGIALSNDDQISKPTTSGVAWGQSINIVRVGTEVITEEVTVPREVELIYDSNMFSGQTEVREAGADGIDIVTFELELENGVEISRRELQKVRKTEPVKEVRVVGTKVTDPSSNVAVGQSLAAARGWTEGEWQCLFSLWTKESGWNHLAENPSSGAYGIPQSLPGTKMAVRGSDWRTNPATQIEWGLDYIGGRYGTPCGAWNHSVANNWY